jgi:transposase
VIRTDASRDADLNELKALLKAALARVSALEEKVARLEQQNAELKQENGELRARLNQNSQNSSKPPSSDGPEVKRPTSPQSTRKRGGQPGHEGAKRVRLAADIVVDHRPKRCRGCAQALDGTDPEPKWCQVIELPEIKPQVTEHRAHALLCDGCGVITEQPLPDGALLHGFGPRLSGLVAYLTGRCRLSKRQVVELCEDALGVALSTGAVCAIEQDVSAALAAPVEEARAVVREQAVVHVDETGWREDKQKAWLWTAVTSVAVVFQIARSRGGVIARSLLGADFRGLLVTDRWSAYNWVASALRQLCWSHLARDFRGMVERGGVGGALAALLVAEVDKMFASWGRVRDGTLDREEFQRLMKPVRAEIERLLESASWRAEPKTAGMCAEILKLRPALWTFVDQEGVEPTNNAAERAIRPAVLWRKGSFGTDSQVGSRFAERVLTAVATVRLRGGNVLRYLMTATAQYRDSRTAPSLLATQ